MRIVFDTKLMRPACALLQAVMGGSYGMANHFPAELWLTSPTEDMRVYEISPAQLVELIEVVSGKLS